MKPSVAILHYSAPPVVGGVEAVIAAHVQLLVGHGYPVTVVAGRGSADALPDGADLVLLPLLDALHPPIAAAGAELETGIVPASFDALTAAIESALAPVLRRFDHVIVHNVFTKHFNLPLTAALDRLLDRGDIRHGIAWSHDFTWTSPNSRDRVHAGQPWDLLRTGRRDVTHVVVSAQRQATLAELYGWAANDIHVVYNGVDPTVLYGLSAESAALVDRLGLLSADLILLMPVRVTQAKNIEFGLAVTAALQERGMGVKLVHTGPPDPHDAQSMAYFRRLQQQRDALSLADCAHFVYESGPTPDTPYEIPLSVVADLYRVADILLMPSHREGFGMPILEAGLLGLPVVASGAVPAAVEIGRSPLSTLSADAAPEAVAAEIADFAAADARLRLAREVRQTLTWDALFRRRIEPLFQLKEAKDDPST